MKKILITAVALALAVPALAAQQDIAQLSDVTASREALRTAINTQLSAVQANFDEVYAVIDAGPVYVNASAPADTKVVWIDTDQSNAIKVYVGGVWTVVGTAGSGDDLGSAAYADVVALWTTCTGYLKSDGTCDTPSGSATYPSAAGVANWGGSAWGTSYTVGTGASNLVQLNGSAQLPAVSADLLTITDTGTYFTTDTVAAALQELGSGLADVTEITLDASLTQTGGVLSVTNPVPVAITMNSGGDLATTGTIKGRTLFNSYAVDQTLTAATHNSTVVQATEAIEITMWDCEAANVGDTVLLWARDAEKIEVAPATGDGFALFDGTPLTAGNELDVAATKGTKVTLMCTADDLWSVFHETAPATDGGIAD